MAVTALRQVAEQRGIYEVTPVKPMSFWWQSRKGLWTGKHRRRMGAAIWLYGYLQSNADIKTGVVATYHHAEAACELDAPERTVQDWLRHLVTAGYVTVAQHRYHLSITITNYRPSGDYGESQDSVSLKSQGHEKTDAGSRKNRPRLTESRDPMINQIDQINQIDPPTGEIAPQPEIPEPAIKADEIWRRHKGYEPTSAFFETITDCYSKVNLLKEAVKMDGWLQRHSRRKCSTDFICNWLDKAVRDLEAGNYDNGSRPYPAGRSAGRNQPGSAEERAGWHS